jgi:hypothetical protein
MTGASAWAALAGLGAFHGINPGMGWLFAVALGLQRQSRGAVLWSLLPIALGHAVSIALVVAALAALRVLVDLRILQGAAALLLFVFGLYRLAARHKARGGMQVGFADLTLWSFLMATGHGAGLMLIPVLLKMPVGVDHARHQHMTAMTTLGKSAGAALAAVGVHTLAMLAVTGLVAILVYEWVGLTVLRRGWINLDLLWALALIGAGTILLAAAIG